MVDEKAPPAKQGLHGWRAAAAVFGCGSLAAFGVFGVLIGLFSMFFNFTSAGIQGTSETSNPSAEHVGEPQASIEPGDLDLCGRNLDSSSQLSLMRTGSEENYADTVAAGERRISDHCEWEMIPDYNSTQNWSLGYSYDAVIDSSDGLRVDVASTEFDGRVDVLGDDFLSIESQGEADLADRSYFVYGEIATGVTGYVLLAQTRSAVYEIRIEAEGDAASGVLVPENAMYREASKLVSVSDVEFKVWIPGTD
ncbi:hypothetical protein [Nocardiopsis sp. NPDC055824]